MLRKNNSDPAVCVNNLMQIARGEVPYERVKGISTDAIDTPISHATDEITEDAEWMLGTYEPRAEIESIDITPADTPRGHFSLNANIKVTKEADA